MDIMNIFTNIALFSIAMGAAATSAATAFEAKAAINVAAAGDGRCKKEVNQYIEAVQFVRQSAGDEVGAKVMNNYVGLGQLNQLVSSSGYCAGAQVLREKRATR